MKNTTITIKQKTWLKLMKLRTSPKETMDDIINKALDKPKEKKQ
jgi:hypothetical protein